MIAAMGFAVLTGVPGWVGRIALLGVLLCVMDVMVLWCIPDRVAWKSERIGLWLGAMWGILVVLAQNPMGIGWREVILLLVPGMLVSLTALVGMLHRRRLRGQKFRLEGLAFLLMCSLFFSVSWMCAFNERYDFHDPQTFSAEVTGRYRSGGRGGTHYYAELRYVDEQGLPQNTRLEVKKSRYEGLENGQTVALTRYRGALDMPWFTGAFEQEME